MDEEDQNRSSDDSGYETPTFGSTRLLPLAGHLGPGGGVPVPVPAAAAAGDAAAGGGADAGGPAAVPPIFVMAPSESAPSPGAPLRSALTRPPSGSIPLPGQGALPGMGKLIPSPVQPPVLSPLPALNGSAAAVGDAALLCWGAARACAHAGGGGGPRKHIASKE